MEVVFSTIWKGLPGYTRVILKNVEPKSKPMTLAEAELMKQARRTKFISNVDVKANLFLLPLFSCIVVSFMILTLLLFLTNLN